MNAASRNGLDHREVDGCSPVLHLADRLIGDALIGAMLVLGFVLCLGAARAETVPPAVAAAVAMQN
jgi:hypothetical protein